LTGERDDHILAHMIDISVCVPIYNEEENLPILAREVKEALEPTGKPFELILVDDGSKDGSWAAMKRLKSEYGFIRLIRFKRNCGLTAGLDAGIRAARGRIVVTLDGDLQNDPRDIPRLAAMLDSYDGVFGVRARREDPWIRLMSSRIANWVRNKLLKVKLTDTGCGIRVMRREALQRVKLFNGLHRFFPVLLMMDGYRITEVEVAHRARKYGTSKFNIRNRVFRALGDCLAVRWMMRRRMTWEISETAD